MLVRVLIFIAIVAAIFVPLNWIAYRQLVRIHPRRKRWIATALIAGNLVWPLFPFLQRSSAIVRVLRSTLGPVWFSWTCFAIVYLVMLLLLLVAWIPFRRGRTFAAFARWPSRVFLALMLIGSIIGFYGALVPLRIERVTIGVDDLPSSVEGTRIALLSDLHVGLFTRRSRLKKIFRTTAALNPDLVLLSGDLIDDDPFFVPKLLEGTRPVAANTPILAVYGNHEMYGNPRIVAERMRGSRVRLLVNEGFAHRDLWIAGLSDYAANDIPGLGALKPDFDRALAGRPSSSIPLALAHQSRLLGEAARRRIPVALCGHTHGGQMGIRRLRWSLAGVFDPYHMGLYQVGPTQLYVNTGTGYWLVPFRLGMSPEITLIELRNSKSLRASK